MTAAPTVTERRFELHGIAFSVSAREPAVIDAMELRLRDFASHAGTEPEIRLEFVADDIDDEPPRGAARPV
jgi:hypothetical protein